MGSEVIERILDEPPISLKKLRSSFPYECFTKSAVNLLFLYLPAGKI